MGDYGMPTVSRGTATWPASVNLEVRCSIILWSGHGVRGAGVRGPARPGATRHRRSTKGQRSPTYSRMTPHSRTSQGRGWPGSDRRAQCCPQTPFLCGQGSARGPTRPLQARALETAAAASAASLASAPDMRHGLRARLSAGSRLHASSQQARASVRRLNRGRNVLDSASLPAHHGRQRGVDLDVGDAGAVMRHVDVAPDDAVGLDRTWPKSMRRSFSPRSGMTSCPPRRIRSPKGSGSIIVRCVPGGKPAGPTLWNPSSRRVAEGGRRSRCPARQSVGTTSKPTAGSSIGTACLRFGVARGERFEHRELAGQVEIVRPDGGRRRPSASTWTCTGRRNADHGHVAQGRSRADASSSAQARNSRPSASAGARAWRDSAGKDRLQALSHAGRAAASPT